MYGKYLVGKRKFAVTTLTGILRGGRRPPLYSTQSTPNSVLTTL